MPEKKPILISVYCNKGGVGKTTLVHNLAYILATEFGFKVLAVDADPQCNLSNQLLKTPKHLKLGQKIEDPESLVSEFYDMAKKVDPQSDKQYHIYDCFKPLINLNERGRDRNFMERASQVVLQETAYKNLFLLPGHIRFSDAAETAGSAYHNLRANNVSETSYFSYLTNYIRRIAEVNAFEIVLIDLNPGISVLNANFILASDYFFIPTHPDCFTRQSVEALCEKIPEWVKGMEFYRRESLSEDLRLPLPSKFLGYTALRYPSRSQTEAKEDVVASYLKWWDRIHEVMKTQLVKTLEDVELGDSEHKKTMMLSPNFNLFRFGIKDFASAGSDTQNYGWPISDANINEGKANLEARTHFYREFRRLAFSMLGNMSSESLAQLGFADHDNLSISGKLFGALKTTDEKIEIKNEKTAQSFYLYKNSEIDKNAVCFCQLPIPLSRREIAKRLLGCLDDISIIEFLAREMIETCIREDELPAVFGTRTNARTAQQQKMVQAIETLKAAKIREPEKAPSADLIKFCSTKKCIKTYVNTHIENEKNKNFGFYQNDCFYFETNSRHLLQAILTALSDDEKINLHIYQAKAGIIEQVFEYQHHKSRHTIHVFIEKDLSAQKDIVRLILPSSHMLKQNVYQQRTGIDDVDHWYTAEEINILLNHYLEDGVDAKIFAPAHPFIKGDQQQDEASLALFKECISNAIGSDIPSLIPLNLDDTHVSGDAGYIGSHWVALIIQPNTVNQSMINVHFLDPLKKNTKFGDVLAIIQEIMPQDMLPIPLLLKQQQQTEGTVACGAFTVANFVNIVKNGVNPPNINTSASQLRGQHAAVMTEYQERLSHPANPHEQSESLSKRKAEQARSQAKRQKLVSPSLTNQFAPLFTPKKPPQNRGQPPQSQFNQRSYKS